jgi:hypothetical protein
MRTQLLIGSLSVLILSMPEECNSADSAAAKQWQELNQAPSIYHELSLLQAMAQTNSERGPVLNKLRVMWDTRDVLRRPLIAELMCQMGDRSRVEEVASAFFAGDYDTGRSLEPDGSAAGLNATDAAYRTLILYGAPQHHHRLLGFLKLQDDPLRKGGNLCSALLSLSSTNHGRGLPIGYPTERFPKELVIHCLDYTQTVGTIVFVADGSWHPQRGCDYAAQTIQYIAHRDFGHNVRNSVEQRDAAIAAIKKWWLETQKK